MKKYIRLRLLSLLALANIVQLHSMKKVMITIPPNDFSKTIQNAKSGNLISMEQLRRHNLTLCVTSPEKDYVKNIRRACKWHSYFIFSLEVQQTIFQENDLTKKNIAMHGDDLLKELIFVAEPENRWIERGLTLKLLFLEGLADDKQRKISIRVIRNIHKQIFYNKAYAPTIRNYLKEYSSDLRINDSVTKPIHFGIWKLCIEHKLNCAQCCAMPKYGTPLYHVCARCKKVSYCSRKHQRDDWKKHKKNCCLEH